MNMLAGSTAISGHRHYSPACRPRLTGASGPALPELKCQPQQILLLSATSYSTWASLERLDPQNFAGWKNSKVGLCSHLRNLQSGPPTL